MAQSGFINCLEGLFSSFQIGKLAEATTIEPSRIGRIDRCVLQVAMGIAALDGEVTPDEFKMFETLARKCRGANEKSVKEIFDAGLRFAGYLELQARRLEKEDLLKLFTDEVFDLLPDGFFRSDAEAIRRALAMWVMIAMADGSFAGVERLALLRLREKIQLGVAAADRTNVPFAVSSIGLMPGTLVQQPVTHQVPTEDFLHQVEVLVSQMKQESTAVRAEAEFEKLMKGEDHV